MLMRIVRRMKKRLIEVCKKKKNEDKEVDLRKDVSEDEEGDEGECEVVTGKEKQETDEKERKKVFRDIGFGGLLKLILKENHLELIHFLLINFNYRRCSVEIPGGELRIREEDALSVFDLPQGRKVIPESHALKGNAHIDRIVSQFTERWNVQINNPLLKVMREGLSERQDFDDDFKLDFVVFAVSSIIKSNHDRNVNYRFLESLYDLCYLERVEFLQIDNPRIFPVCSNWKSVDVSKRLNFERNFGGFGSGIVLNCLSKPMKLDENETSVKLKSVFEKMTTAVVEFKDVMDDIGKEPLKIEGILKKPFDASYNSSQEAKIVQEPEISSQSKIVESPKVSPVNKQYKDMFADDLFGDPDVVAEIFKYWDACSWPKVNEKEKEKENEKEEKQKEK
ncbi:hypothetical protein CASFOL_042824 [Castilleja foliolosa]|uniref:Uncharacterized protein n=1 Tax=Castilleja foliolosa TaxID=1961234 RepID=A0ABD3B7R9_9LAMI